MRKMPHMLISLWSRLYKVAQFQISRNLHSPTSLSHLPRKIENALGAVAESRLVNSSLESERNTKTEVFGFQFDTDKFKPI